jgi:hypothetical protein
MPDGEGEDVLLPKRKKPPDIWQITMIDAIIAAHKNATLAEECAAEIAANVAAAAAAAAAATTTMAKITVIKSQTHLSSPLPSSQPPTPKPPPPPPPPPPLSRRRCHRCSRQRQSPLPSSQPPITRTTSTQPTSRCHQDNGNQQRTN